jgi:outer membrane immunogenic protein
MSLRTLGLIAGLGAIAAFSAQAQEPIGDPVDQLLNAKTASSPDVPPPLTPTAAPQPSPAVSIAPVALQPPPANAPPATTPPPAAAPPPADLAGGVLTSPPATLPTERWSGFYVGVNFGGGNTTGGNGASCTNTDTGTSQGCDIITNGALSTSGVLGGGQFGYLRRLALGWRVPLVVGAEVDFDGSGISGSQNVGGPFSFVGVAGTCSSCAYNARQSLDSFTTIRARVGVPLDDAVLLYATGGVALGGVKVSQELSFLGSSEADVVSRKTTLAGPVAGAGVEVALFGPWSARVEGLYYDLGNLNTTGLPVNGAFANYREFKTFGFRGGIVRLAINLRLGDLPY